jgi:hypothetical protein
MRKKKRPKPGRPALQNGETPNVTLRLPSRLLAGVETWRRRQSDNPARAEAIRRLLGFALAMNPKLDGTEGS